MTIDKITIEDMEKLMNTLNIGYPIVYCSINDLKILQEKFPQLKFTSTSLVEDNTIMLVPSDKLITYKTI